MCVMCVLWVTWKHVTQVIHVTLSAVFLGLALGIQARELMLVLVRVLRRSAVSVGMRRHRPPCAEPWFATGTPFY